MWYRVATGTPNKFSVHTMHVDGYAACEAFNVDAEIKAAKPSAVKTKQWSTPVITLAFYASRL